MAGKTASMKKIGILHGKETSFPEAFVARVNSKNVKGVAAEPTHVDELMQGNPTPYAVMIDRISQDVPFYRAYVKNAALNGTAVLNNPFLVECRREIFQQLPQHQNWGSGAKNHSASLKRNAARHLRSEFPQPQVSAGVGQHD